MKETTRGRTVVILSEAKNPRIFSKPSMNLARMLPRLLLAILFIAAGSLHFLIPQTYVRIMPPYIPAHLLLVHISGLCEIFGGLGLFFQPPIRTLAAWGLVALLISVMPANIYMATDHASYPAIPAWTLYLRLPLQLPLIWWAWLYTRR